MKLSNEALLRVPHFITHYSRGEPFRSITGLTSDKQATAIQSLNESNAWGLARFRDPEYLSRRTAVEKELRQAFIGLGGIPQLESPIYFFLGRNERFEQHKANKRYQIELKDIAATALSFTYGDILLGIDKDYRTKVGGSYQSSLCGRLFLLNELEGLLSHPELNQEWRLHIEAQLWVMPSSGIVKRF